MHKDSIKKITEVVFPTGSDYFKQVDLLIVLGSLKVVQYKMPEVIALYKCKRVKKLLFTGGNTCLSGELEFEAMQGYALKHGVADSDIYLEREATNPKENATFSAKLLSQTLPELKSVAILTTAFHIKRALHLFKAELPATVSLYGHMVNDNHTRIDNWWMSKAGITRVLHSYQVIQAQQQTEKLK